MHELDFVLHFDQRDVLASNFQSILVHVESEDGSSTGESAPMQIRVVRDSLGTHHHRSDRENSATAT